MGREGYQLLGELGRGGMGVVYRARDGRGTEVALKTVKVGDPVRLAALRREIRALSRLEHPGIVHILDEGVDEDGPWFAMELVRGRALADSWDTVPAAPTATLDATDLPLDELPPDTGLHPDWRERVVPLAHIALALAHLHGRRLVHGDLKPSNVVLRDDGQPVLVDFGLAARLGLRESAQSLTLTASGIGSPPYLAPERAAGRPADSRADLYALGCMLYEALTGAPPFTGDAWSVVRRHKHSPVPQLPDAVPPELARLTMALLAKQPSARPASALAVARILGVAPPAGARPALLRPALAGRARERDALVTHLDRLATGAGRAVVLLGPAGTGKTRLALEVIADAHAAGVHVVAGTCAPADGPTSSPLSVFGNLLQYAVSRAAPGELREYGPFLLTWAPALRPIADREQWTLMRDLPPDVGRAALVDAMVGVVRMVAAEPLLLVIDDAQWADPLSHEVLTHLVSIAADLPLMVLATVRGDAVPDGIDSAEVIDVGPLDGIATDTLIADMLGAERAPAALTAWIGGVAQGNPFLVGEAVRLAVHEAALTHDPARGWVVAGTLDALPADTDAILDRRVRHLAGDAGRLLDAAAVAGDSAPQAVLAACTGLSAERLLDATLALEEAEVLVQTPLGSAFAHARLRDAAYHRLAPPDRIAVHRLAAETLDRLDGDWLPERAHHWDHAGEPAIARPLYRDAAERAVRGHAIDVAERLLMRALDLPEPTSEEEIELTELLARGVHNARGDHRTGLARLQPLLERPITGPGGVALHATAVDSLQLLGRYDESERLLEVATPVAESVGGPAPASALWTRVAEQHHRRGRNEQARAAIGRALDLARRSGDRHRILRVHYTATSIARAAGQVEEALAWARTLRIEAEREGSVWLEALGLQCEGLLALDQGDSDTVLACLGRAAKLFGRMRDRRHQALALGNLAGAWFHKGDYDRAAARLHQAVDALESVGDTRSVALYVSNLGSVHEAREAYEDAREAYRRASTLLLELEDAEAAPCLAARARVERRLGTDPDLIAAILDRAEAAGIHLDPVNRLTVMLERVAFEASRGTDATALLDQAEALAAEFDHLPTFLVVPLEEARRLARPG